MAPFPHSKPWAAARNLFHSRTHPDAHAWFDAIIQDKDQDTPATLLFIVHNIVLSHLTVQKLRIYHKPFVGKDEWKTASVGKPNETGNTKPETDLKSRPHDEACAVVWDQVKKQWQRSMKALQSHPGYAGGATDWAAEKRTREMKVELDSFFELRFEEACDRRVSNYQEGKFSLLFKGKQPPKKKYPRKASKTASVSSFSTLTTAAQETIATIEAATSEWTTSKTAGAADETIEE